MPGTTFNPWSIEVMLGIFGLRQRRPLACTDGCWVRDLERWPAEREGWIDHAGLHLRSPSAPGYGAPLLRACAAVPC